MELLFQSEHMELRYNQSRDIIFGEWSHCDNAETLIEGIRNYKEVFEKIVPEKIIWNEAGLKYSIPPNLQDWILNFLDIPACDHSIDYKVAHILSPDMYANLSLMDMYTDGRTTFTPCFFAHEQAALSWIEAPHKNSETGAREAEWKIDRFIKENKARITIDVDLDQLPLYLQEVNKVIHNRRFYLNFFQRFSTLTRKEKSVLTLIIRGKLNKEIAEMTCTSCETIKTHRRNLLRKLECNNMAELMRFHVFL